ncbi:MAG: DNA polymerase III subunit delta' [Minwuia sp.]|uniref:DNA polymerase III subunit delta' n=1 Tax=Minwuia sp. TaxID=2493630 RepID=UPI003A872B8F
MSRVVEPRASNSPDRPAPDEVSEALHPSRTTFLSGHREAEAALAAAVSGGSLHHAWLISGPFGIGKATLGYRFARRLLDPEAAGGGLFGDPPSDLHTDPERELFTQVATGSHPNMVRLTRPWDWKAKKYRTEIVVDEVRRLHGFLGQSASRAGRRVVLVDAADEMNENAANALLKPLEEPPPNAVFILICHQPGALIGTIRSRCRRLDLRPPSPDQALEAMTRLAPALDRDAAGLLLELSEQSPGRALRLAEEDGLALYREMMALLASAPRISRAAAQKLAGSLDRGAQAERRFVLFTELLEGMLRRLILNRPGPPEEAGLRERLAGGRLDQWFDLCDNLQRLRARTLAVNLNRKAVTLTLVSAFEDAARAAAT